MRPARAPGGARSVSSEVFLPKASRFYKPARRSARALLLLGLVLLLALAVLALLVFALLVLAVLRRVRLGLLDGALLDERRVLLLAHLGKHRVRREREEEVANHLGLLLAGHVRGARRLLPLRGRRAERIGLGG